MTDTQHRPHMVVLGAGSWGAALAHQARLSGKSEVRLLARSAADCESLAMGKIRQLPQIAPIEPLDADTNPAILAQADVILLAAPLSAHPHAAEQITGYARDGRLYSAQRGWFRTQTGAGCFCQNMRKLSLPAGLLPC